MAHWRWEGAHFRFVGKGFKSCNVFAVRCVFCHYRRIRKSFVLPEVPLGWHLLVCGVKSAKYGGIQVLWERGASTEPEQHVWNVPGCMDNDTHIMCTVFWSTRIPLTHVHPFLILTVKVLLHGINFLRHSLHICSCIPHYQQASCQVCPLPCPNTNAPWRISL